MKKNTGICVILIVCMSGICVSLRLDCPVGWEELEDHCYRFNLYPSMAHAGANADCASDGAFLLSVTNDLEHLFVQDELSIVDGGQIKREWWTSGRRKTPGEVEFFWEGDGKNISSYFYWLDNTTPEDFTRDIIVYHYDEYQWGWTLARGVELLPYVCKISKDKIARIQHGERGKDFGQPTTDPALIPSGPYFVQQPKDVIYEPVQDSRVVLDQTEIECRAEGNPTPSYRWFRTQNGEMTEVELDTDKRLTLINGKLVIAKPSQARGDGGLYKCQAENEYGVVVSNTIELSFAYLHEFPKSPRSAITPLAYTWTAIECNPPSHYPAISYSWFKNSQDNFIQTHLKPYIFISNNGKLYFSEVTQDDEGQYYCVATRFGKSSRYGSTSMPTEMRVIKGSPGIYDPHIPDDFPYVYPENPKVGDNVRMECWASGTSRIPLEYYWRKVIIDDKGKVVRELPLPRNATLTDHNRVLNIREIGLYDAGNYTCTVHRREGGTTVRIKQLFLQAEPYFVLPLKNSYPDVGSTLSWRCEAGGIPQPKYMWFKDGERIEGDMIADGRVTVSNNVVTITSADGKKDDGMYQCAAENRHAIRYSAAELKVMAFKPNFIKYPLQLNQYATINGNATLVCRPEAAPTAEVKWYKNGRELSPGTDENSRVRLMPNRNLLLSPVKQTDRGNYTCIAENKYGAAASSGNLTVLKGVTISLPPQGAAIPYTQSRFIHCVASYNPQLDVTYTWFHNNLHIEFERVFRLGENRYQIWRNPYHQRGVGIAHGGLLIQHALPEHEGLYTCKVEDMQGQTFKRSAEVKIVGPPYEPAGVRHSAPHVGLTSALVKWKASGNNGAPIRSYVVEAFNYWAGYWTVVMAEKTIDVDIDVTQTYSLNVTGLRPFSDYQIRIKAVNVYGASNASQPSGKFSTGSIKPDLAPTNISGGGGKVGDLVITWTPLDPWEENGAGFGYKLFWREKGDPDWGERYDVISGNPGRHVRLVGQHNFYRRYEIMLQAFNDLGEGPESDIVTIRSAMGMPKAVATDVMAQPYNSTACIVTWVPVDANNRQDIKGQLGGYKLAYWEEKFGPNVENPWRVTYNGQMNSSMVIGLDPNTKYYFAVYVWNEAGNGPKSEYFLQRTLRSAPIDQPVEVKVYRKGKHSIHVYWRGVSTTQREEPLEGYKVRLWHSGKDIKHAKDYKAEKEVDLHVDDLHPDILYKLRVFAFSRGGDGTMSSPAVQFMLGGAYMKQASILFLVLGLALQLLCRLR